MPKDATADAGTDQFCGRPDNHRSSIDRAPRARPNPIRRSSKQAHRQPRLAYAFLRYQEAIVDSAFDALIGMDLQGIVHTWNRGASRLFGYSEEEAVGMPLGSLAEASQRVEQLDLVHQARAGDHPGPIETTGRRQDGTTVPLELSIIPVRNPRGRVVALAAVARDISARKRADAWQMLVAEELRHRIKNTLASVQSIARLSLRGSASLEAFSATFSARLNALSSTQDLLARSNGKGITLSEIIEAELSPYSSAAAPRWSTSGKNFTLDPRRAIALGMMLHELATNAAKYGAFSVLGGCVEIAWQTTADNSPRLKLIWSERNGPPVQAPTRQGFGTRLVTKSLATELGGEVKLTFLRTGVHCAIDVPLDAAQ